MSHAEPADRIAIIGNPVSGRGRGAGAFQAVEARLKERGLPSISLRTERPGHAVDLARSTAEAGVERLVVIGGDGTFRDVLEGVAAAGALDQTRLALIPAGTGNDLARTLRIPHNAADAAAVALDGTERRLDLWCWNGRPFVNVAGLGLDAAVGGYVNRRVRHLHGPAAYVAAFVGVLPGFKPLPVRLEWPGDAWEGEVWLTAFANARSYGGGMLIAPEAEPDDGLLDVVIVEGIPKLELLANFPRLFSGTHVRHPRVRSFRVPSLRITAPPQEVTLDGELIAGTPAELERSPQAVRMVVPAAG